MSNRKLSFEFNTAITAIEDQTSGAFNNDRHNELVKPVRAQIMASPNSDGLVGCHIARYGMSVEFLDNVTTVQAVTELVQTAIEWATANGLFPLCGDKTPTATLERADSNEQWIVIDFSTDLVTFKPVRPDSDQTGRHWKAFYDSAQNLVRALIKLDGIVDIEIRPRYAALKIRPGQTDTQVVIDHMWQVLEGYRDLDDSYFPFVTDEHPLKLTLRES